MGELGALFNPGMRHELEERQAKAARREEEGNAKDGDLRIDLESGVAVINAPGAQGDPVAEDDDPAADTGDSRVRAASSAAGENAATRAATRSGAADGRRDVAEDEVGESDQPAGGSETPEPGTQKRSTGRPDGSPMTTQSGASRDRSAGQPGDAVRPRGTRGAAAAR